MTLKSLSAEHIPGWQVRLRLLERGAEWQRRDLIARLDQIVNERRKAAESAWGVAEGVTIPAYSKSLTYDEVFGLLADEFDSID